MRNVQQAAAQLITVVVLASCSTRSSQSYRNLGSPDECGPLLTDVMNQTRAGDSSDRLIAPGITVCAAGNIFIYEGLAQMELGSPAELESWK